MSSTSTTLHTSCSHQGRDFFFFLFYFSSSSSILLLLFWWYFQSSDEGLPKVNSRFGFFGLVSVMLDEHTSADTLSYLKHFASMSFCCIITCNTRHVCVWVRIGKRISRTSWQNKWNTHNAWSLYNKPFSFWQFEFANVVFRSKSRILSMFAYVVNVDTLCVITTCTDYRVSHYRYMPLNWNPSNINKIVHNMLKIY